MNIDIWKPIETHNSFWYCWILSGAKAYLCRNKEHWRTAFETIPFRERTEEQGGPDIVDEGPAQKLPLSSTWGEGKSAMLRPYFSARPYFVTAKERTRLLQGFSVSFIADLPPLLKFEEPGDIVLAEAMPFSLSTTWVGDDTTTGIFCHSLPGSLIPLTEAPSPYAPPPLIRCTITIKNNSKTFLDLDHLVIYPEQLNIYEQNGDLFSSILNIDFPGNNLKMSIHRTNDPNWNLLTPCVKNDLGELIAQWGIGMIKSLTQL